MNDLSNQSLFPTVTESEKVDYGDGEKVHHTTIAGITYFQWLTGLAMQGLIAAKADFSHEWRNDKNEIRLLNAGQNPMQDGTNWKLVATSAERLARQARVHASHQIIELERATA